ncbi:MAG: PQQ-binding-like beta-propeller repeat protein [Acidimicrobiales bacterium]
MSDIASDGEQFIQLSASTGTLEARSIATGDLVWSVATSTAIDWGQLAIAGDLVYVVGRNGMVSAHALADGSVRWSGQVDGLGERDQSYVYLAVAEDRLAVVEDDLLRVTTAN